MNMYEEQYTVNAVEAAEKLLESLEGAIRHGADEQAHKQLKTQLSRWLKRQRKKG